jgi:site-specific DNA-cytosine methylase
VFVIAIFDPVLANRSPNPLLPVAKSLPGHLAKGKPQRQNASTTLTEGVGTDSGIVNAIGASIYHKSTVVNQDANAGHMVVETNPTRLLGSQIIGSLNATDYKWPQNQQLDENKFIVEPMLSFDTQFGSNANVTEDVAPTLKASQQSPSVAYNAEPTMSLTLTAYNMDSRSPQSEEQQRIVNAVFESTMAVRRLTPLECERLMGWPDHHTRYKADGTEQADTHRYKQCGNGVASPVAQWIAKHILAI